MILDRLENASLYTGYNPRMKAAFEFLQKHRDGNLADGEHEIDGRNCYAIVMDIATREQKDAVWEAHRKYIDIQYIVRGNERMGWAHLDNVKNDVTSPYDNANDYELYKGNGSWLDVQAGEFAVFGPTDVHAPIIRINNCEKVKKIVIKVAVK
jgi:YhcH/YjgK/YiaL family protein